MVTDLCRSLYFGNGEAQRREASSSFLVLTRPYTKTVLAGGSVSARLRRASVMLTCRDGVSQRVQVKRMTSGMAGENPI